jgi:hypothetical protein
MCNGIEKIKCTLMKCHTNVNSTPFTQLPHKFSYIVAILGHNHFESPNMCATRVRRFCSNKLVRRTKPSNKNAVCGALYVFTRVVRLQSTLQRQL